MTVKPSALGQSNRNLTELVQQPRGYSKVTISAFKRIQRRSWIPAWRRIAFAVGLALIVVGTEKRLLVSGLYQIS